MHSNCTAYSSGGSTYQKKEKLAFDAHKAREMESMKEKESDKARSKEDPSFHAVVLHNLIIFLSHYNNERFHLI